MITRYRSNAMAMILNVDTYIEVASSPLIILHAMKPMQKKSNKISLSIAFLSKNICEQKGND